MKDSSMTRVLIAPLDWGLGHATRCIPVIREFQRRACAVVVAGSGDSLELLRQEFPELPAFQLPAYRPRYPHNASMTVAMARQLPRFVSAIRLEHRVLNRIVESEDIHIIVSDNRYGCWSPKVPSVFITHQSNILMPRRFGWLGSMVRAASDRLISRFTCCWVPDSPHGPSLAGDLGSFRNSNVRIPRVNIGWLSRFQRTQDREKKYDVVAVLSGPEPQRSILESIVVPQLISSGLEFRVARGLPRRNGAQGDPRIFDFLCSAELQPLLESADVVIARSGFSTIMDLQALGKKAVFIPTPGQTEQEYLAARLMDQGIAFCMEQEKFELREALAQSRQYSGFTDFEFNTALTDAVDSLLALR